MRELVDPPNRMSDIAHKRRDISADTALRLARYFKTDPHFWLNRQTAHDVSKAQAANDYSKIVPRARRKG